jgi:hypothetical protein
MCGVACGSGPSSSDGEPRTPLAAVRAAPSDAPPAVSDRETPVPAAADECHWSSELQLAYQTIHPEQEQMKWIDASRARLLDRDVAERALTGIAQTVVSALAHRRYRDVAALVGDRGLCLRAAKGTPCVTLSSPAVAACGQSRTRRKWEVDDGGESHEYTCGGAFRHVFYDRDFLRTGDVRFNCFPAPGRGKNVAPIIASGPARGYVEFHDAGTGRDSEKSLWLVFDGDPSSPELVEVISESWGT